MLILRSRFHLLVDFKHWKIHCHCSFVRIKNCPDRIILLSKFNTFREFIISLYLFEVKQGSSLAFYLPSLRNRIVMVQWKHSLTPCSVHATAELPTKLDQRCAWALLFGQTTRWSKNMLTYIVNLDHVLNIVCHMTQLLPGQWGNCCVKSNTRAPIFPPQTTGGIVTYNEVLC